MHGCSSASRPNSPQVPAGAAADNTKLGLAQGFSDGGTGGANGLLDDPLPDPFEDIDWPIVPFTDPRTGDTYNIAEGRVIVKLTNTPQLPQMDPNYFDVEREPTIPYYNVAYHPLMNDPAVAAFVAAEQLEVFTGWPEIGSIGVLLPEGTTMLDAVQNWPTEYPNVVQAADPDAILTYSDYPWPVGDPNDFAFQHQGTYWGQWNLDNPDQYEEPGFNPYHINIQEAWHQRIFGSPNVVVAVIDSGVEWHLPDMQPSSTWYGCNVYNKVSSTRFRPRYLNGGEPDDYVKNYNATSAKACGHGTIVASIISAGLNNDFGHVPGIRDGYDIAGVAPFCKYFPIACRSKWTGTDAQGNDIGGATSSSIINAFSVVGSVKRIYDCNRTLLGVGGGAPYYNIEVVNCSVGFRGWSSSLYQAVINVSRYVNVVCAAGNEGYTDHSDCPALFTWLPGLICVSGYNALGQLEGYNQAPDTTIQAPAVGIPGLDIVGTNVRSEQLGWVSDAEVWCSLGGTSFAAPQVSGVAALLVSQYPTLTSAQVKYRIDHYAFSDMNYGRLNCMGALSGT